MYFVILADLLFLFSMPSHGQVLVFHYYYLHAILVFQKAIA